ncbi:hypothetical protein QTP88_017264 [Uroleucon formosanum]
MRRAGHMNEYAPGARRRRMRPFTIGNDESFINSPLTTHEDSCSVILSSHYRYYGRIKVSCVLLKLRYYNHDEYVISGNVIGDVIHMFSEIGDVAFEKSKLVA